jgi:hypothetical protein
MNNNAFGVNDDGLARQRDYSAQLSEISLSALKRLVGVTVDRIYASSLQVSGDHLTAPSFSIPISTHVRKQWVHRYVVIRGEWFETPHTLTDYWQMSASLTEERGNVQARFEDSPLAPCTIKYLYAEPIQRIEIYEQKWSAGENLHLETVRYDQAIRFYLESGKSFCIACQLDGPGIATEVNISDNEASIASFLKGSSLRMMVPA